MKRKKLLALVLTVSLITGCLIGGTLAWLTDKTQVVKNTFTVGNVDITLAETTGETYKMVPGTTLPKDPLVTVEAGSEDCWLFIKVVEAGGEVTVSENGVEVTKSFEDFIDYAIADGWTALSGTDCVYYREVSLNADNNQEFAVLKDNKVLFENSITKAMMDELEKDTAKYPTLTFTAYAVQKAGMETAAIAWAEVSE